MKVLLAGATGYVGRRLKIRLLEEPGVSLRLLVRDARQVSERARQSAEVVEGNIYDLETARKAVENVDVVYYPIRFFGAVWESAEFDRAAVEKFRDACIEAGVKRLVYVGLPVEHGSVSLLRNVVETGDILSATPDKLQTVWLRAGALLGSGSVMFELLRNVTQKIPLIVSSRWMDARLNTVAVDDVVEYLAQAKDLEQKENLIIDIASDEMSFKEMLKKTARAMGVRRVFIPLPLTAHRLSSFLLTLATPFSFGLSSPLIRVFQSGAIRKAYSLNGDARQYFPGITPICFEDALKRALHEMESDRVMSTWVDSLERTFIFGSEEEITRAIHLDIKKITFGDVPPYKIFRAVKSIGGREGWFTFDFLWRIRGLLDKLAGGYGTTMGKRTVSDLRVGDMLDVWKVIDLKEDKRLLLEAQMKVFGKAWLEFKIDGNTLTQIAHHYPIGILGRLYWYSMSPFHIFIFRDMIRSIVRLAREME